MIERQSTRMSKIKNGGLDQYGAERFEQQHFGITGIEGVNFLYYLFQRRVLFYVSSYINAIR